MKTVLVYLHITDKPGYHRHSREFVETYLKFPPMVEHELVVVSCNAPANEVLFEIFKPLNYTLKEYVKRDWDIPVYQFIAQTVPADFMVLLNSRTYFWKSGWLKRLVEARCVNGEGLYGVAGSFENHPHIKHNCYGFNPAALAKVPYGKIRDRKRCHQFECGGDNFTGQFGGKAFIVTWTEVRELSEARKIGNTFRKGDQSEVLVWDKHTRLYQQANPWEKIIYGNMADGKYNGIIGKFRKLFDTQITRPIGCEFPDMSIEDSMPLPVWVEIFLFFSFKPLCQFIRLLLWLVPRKSNPAFSSITNEAGFEKD